jgi:hypothetical protein
VLYQVRGYFCVGEGALRENRRLSRAGVAWLTVFRAKLICPDQAIKYQSGSIGRAAKATSLVGPTRIDGSPLFEKQILKFLDAGIVFRTVAGVDVDKGVSREIPGIFRYKLGCID